MSFDFKKEFKELYVPSKKPSIVNVPPMNYIAVRGKGNPNLEDSEYKRSLSLLYPIAFTIKMSKMGSCSIEGYFDFVVPPLEGFWWQSDPSKPIDFSDKDAFNFISCIRMPDFATQDVLNWAISEATNKKGFDFTKVELLPMNEGLCVQSLHVGPYDDEPATVDAMDAFARSEGYVSDFSPTRLHHEIYLSDPRKCKPERLRTVLRQPIKQACVD